ncbi:MAG TPA: response regulator [Kofleriaceae bacterium]|nr:response regulator [Kofleriaceae bacterium]
MTRHKVLLIDDSEVSLHFTAGVLSRAGFEVRSSTDVYELGSVLGGWRPDVILTDVDMPGVTGVELCRMLKSSYETAHVPVVLFSALPASELEDLARECEADGFLSKANGLEQVPRELTTLIETALF